MERKPYRFGKEDDFEGPPRSPLLQVETTVIAGVLKWKTCKQISSSLHVF